MKLTVRDGESALLTQWAEALAPVAIRHPDRRSEFEVTLYDAHASFLKLAVRHAYDTDTDEPHKRDPLVIACVRLTFFPGARLARQWLATAVAGYAQHEALELVVADGVRVLDPHDAPYPHAPWNRGTRDGLPHVLTPETLERALAVVMDPAAARALMEAD